MADRENLPTKAVTRDVAAPTDHRGSLVARGLFALQKDKKREVLWFHKVHEAAEQGDAKAQEELGLMYLTGRGVEQDDVQAVYWYRKAAEQGNASAQFTLGGMYDYGRGVTNDDVQAACWYRKAADQSDVLAQCELGCMYYGGRGVAKDDGQAVYWLRKAAEQGDTLAISVLEGLGIDWKNT